MLKRFLRHVLSGGYLWRAVRSLYRRRVTRRGRVVLWLTLSVAFLGVDTRRALVFVPFCLAAPPLLLALPQLFRRAPRLRIAGRIPARLTAGRTITVPLDVTHDSATGGTLSLGWDGPLPAGLSAEPVEACLQPAGTRPLRVPLSLRAARRGRFLLPALGVARTDLFGLLRSNSRWLSSPLLLAYPRYFTFDELALATGRRYQPGGIPLASAVGDSLEFVGTREYREGDPPRKIHWKSWARLGVPVVREFQEEYFSRIALVLDTYLPPRPAAIERQRFEAGISVLASVAEHFSRSDEVVDILAAGPDLYEVSTGRSLGALDNVLDVLACLEPSPAPAFATIEPTLFERLGRLTTVVLVLIEWDEAREAFVRRVRGLGVAVHVLLVHEGDTHRPWSSTRADVDTIALLTPAQVEARLASAESR